MRRPARYGNMGTASKARPVPIIALTASGLQEEVRECHAARLQLSREQTDKQGHLAKAISLATIARLEPPLRHPSP